MKHLNQEFIIKQVVRDFYAKAVNDVFIGYHFRKISTSPHSHEQIISSLEDFDHHLPKIEDFWAAQLIKNYQRKFDRPHVLKVHEYLNIRFGELGRWLTLFRETLNSTLDQSNELFIKEWMLKIDLFEEAFKNYYFKN